MNQMLMLLMLTGGLGSLTGGSTSGNLSSMLPLMLLSGGRMNTMAMMGLMTGNSMLTLMGLTQRRRYRRRSPSTVVVSRPVYRTYRPGPNGY